MKTDAYNIGGSYKDEVIPVHDCIVFGNYSKILNHFYLYYANWEFGYAKWEKIA